MKETSSRRLKSRGLTKETRKYKGDSLVSSQAVDAMNCATMLEEEKEALEMQADMVLYMLIEPVARSDRERSMSRQAWEHGPIVSVEV